MSSIEEVWQPLGFLSVLRRGWGIEWLRERPDVSYPPVSRHWADSHLSEVRSAGLRESFSDPDFRRLYSVEDDLIGR
jgi:hypothetical protein